MKENRMDNLDYQELLQLFRQNSNCQFDNFNNKIINSGVRTIGCTVPFVRSVAKRYANCLAQILALPTHDYFEVDMLKGMAVSLAKLPFDQKSLLLRDFAATLENWAVCDSNTVKVPQVERQLYFDLFSQMCRDDRPFVCRYGLVNLLANFLDEAHIFDIFQLLSEVKFGHYYVDMAVAWLVATAMTKCRDQTVNFMENQARTALNVFAYNTALQKMRDSLRVSVEDKAWTKTLKM